MITLPGLGCDGEEGSAPRPGVTARVDEVGAEDWIDTHGPVVLELHNDESDESDVDESASEAHLVGQPAFPPDQPCGGSTVASIDLGGRQVYFCVVSNGDQLSEGVLEIGSAGLAPLIRDFDCAADVFRALAPNREVPPLLLESCRVPAGESRKLELVAESDPQAYGSFCSGSGASNFTGDINTPCWESYHDYHFPPYSYFANLYCSNPDSSGADDWECTDDSTSPFFAIGYCYAGLFGWHQRTATAALGVSELTETHIRARDFQASCGGVTEFRSWYKTSAAGSWILHKDFNISDGGYGSWFYYPVDFSDIRFRGDSEVGAGHRYTGGFINE